VVQGLTMALIFLEGFTRHERHEATLLLTDAVSRAGWVLDCTQHSNKAVTLRFEVEPHRASVLAEELAKLPVKLSAETVEKLNALVESERRQPEKTEPPLHCSFNLSFLHEEPDLRLTVPSVPG
jgi:hypothetical protein